MKQAYKSMRFNSSLIFRVGPFLAFNESKTVMYRKRRFLYILGSICIDL